MSENEQVVANDTQSSLIEQLGKAFAELEACKNAPDDKVQWVEIEEHFRNLEIMLKKKSDELEAREKELEEKEAETWALVSEREAAVIAKEQDLQDRVQELKDAAVAVIAEARATHMPTPSELVDGDVKESKVSSSLGDANSPEEEFLHKTSENAEGVAVEVKPRPELTQICEQMDAKGLLNFTVEYLKKLYVIRDELSVALESATDPARLVLDTLEGFYPPDETYQSGDNGNAALQGMRKSCIMFLGAMHALLARVGPGADHLLNPETKQQAKAIADDWKPKLAGPGIDATNGNSLEAEAFLQLIATFNIASEFDEEELCKLVLAVARRRQAPQLCHSLGLTHKMPGVIETLINGGRQIDAVHFIHAFQLTESYPPVPLLKTYLKDLRRNSQGKGWNSEDATAVRNDANAQELAALKAVIRCVEDYKLESEYPLEPLQKRVTQLERSKADKKRSGGDFVKQRQQPKKSRANGGYHGFRAPSVALAGGGGRQAPPVYGERAATLAYMGMTERYPPHSVANTYDYQVPSQSSYAHAPQASDQRLYYYPQEDRAATAAAAAAAQYNPDSSSYTATYIGSGLQSPHQPYM